MEWIQIGLIAGVALVNAVIGAGGGVSVAKLPKKGLHAIGITGGVLVVVNAIFVALAVNLTLCTSLIG